MESVTRLQILPEVVSLRANASYDLNVQQSEFFSLGKTTSLEERKLNSNQQYSTYVTSCLWQRIWVSTYVQYQPFLSSLLFLLALPNKTDGPLTLTNVRVPEACLNTPIMFFPENNQFFFYDKCP